MTSKVTQPADTANASVRVTDIQAQFPAFARALALWHLAPQKDYAACWNAFVLIEEELGKLLNSSVLQREWVGLTDEEYRWCSDEIWPMIRVSELLKEKNK